MGVLVSPWQRTAVPFYQIEWAMRLRRRGLDVEFVWDVWPNATDNPTAEEKAILLALEAAHKAFRIPIVIPSATESSTATTARRLALLAFETVTRNRGCEPKNGDPEISEEEGRLQLHAACVQGFLSNKRYSWMLVPGGVWAVSGVYCHVCQVLGIDSTTFDSGPGLLCFQHHGAAAHFPDLDSSMQILAKNCMQNESIRQRVEEWVDNRLSVRRRGDDDFRLQPQAAANLEDFADVVVPLNYRLDTAAMCRQKLFSGVNEWLQALVNWAESRADISIVFRQHPCEKIPAYRSKEDYSWISQRSASNIRFVAAEDPVNTYDLLANCKVVLPYSSRVGIEGAVLGRPVILAASAYYEKMPFVEVAHSKQAYFDLIEKCLKNPAAPSFEQRCSAYAAYFIAENFGLHKTTFTPIPSDFEKWVRRDPAVLWSADRAAVFLEAAVTRKPVADLLIEEMINRWMRA